MFYCKYYINSFKWDINFKSAKCQKQKINEIKRTANKIKKKNSFKIIVLCYVMLCYYEWELMKNLKNSMIS